MSSRRPNVRRGRRASVHLVLRILRHSVRLGGIPCQRILMPCPDPGARLLALRQLAARALDRADLCRIRARVADAFDRRTAAHQWRFRAWYHRLLAEIFAGRINAVRVDVTRSRGGCGREVA